MCVIEQLEGQISLLAIDMERPLYKITKPIRLVEIFAGLGSQAKALKNIGADFEHWFVCEFDKYAVTSYNAIHGTDFEPCDVTKITASDLNIVDTDKYEYLLTYSFPCTDLSNAGKRQGMAKGDNTRSGLLWEIERLLNECSDLPQVLLMENVPQVHGKRNVEHFELWCKFLESLGYKNYWKDLNAKNYGVAQNRNRTFMISLLGNYRYEFPEPVVLEKRLKDYLEPNVEERWYLTDTQIKAIDNPKNNQLTCDVVGSLTGEKWDRMHEQSRRVYGTAGTAPTIHTVGGGNLEPKILEVAKLNPDRHSSTANSVLNTGGLCSTIDTAGGGNREPKILEPIAYDEQNQRLRLDGTCGTLTTDGSTPKHNNRVVEPFEKSVYREQESNSRMPVYVSAAFPNCKVRKLIPLECWRLMDFTDEDFYKAKNALNKTYYKGADRSNSQLYKQCGNSIVVKVLQQIFKQLI